jgi:N-acetyl-gamma-glutamyl-phosphate reductase
MTKISAGIVGATGYTGMELLRLLSAHPSVDLLLATSEKQAGKKVGNTGLTFQPMAAEVKELDVLFSCLPHTGAMTHVASWVKQGIKVIDLSADFRLHDAATYEEWYGEKQTAADLLKKAVYGLPELHRAEIKKATLVANPGCYPTGAVLGLAPLLKSKLIDTTSIVIDSKSGVTGAGRNAAVEFLFSEVNESVHAYKVGNHRHTPEIEQELSLVAGEKIVVSFTPHLIPMDRGILSTIHVRALKKTDTASVLKTFNEFYKNEPFVQVLPEGVLPKTKEVRGTNNCAIGAVYDPRTNQIIIVSAIDNLSKGASSQAVQNMNLMFGLGEKTGLSPLPLVP